MNIDTLAAGREMDLLVARKVMAWDGEGLVKLSLRLSSIAEFQPSTDIAVAMEVVSKLLERKWWMFDMRSSSPGSGRLWFCDAINLSATMRADAGFSTLREIPEAICKAALKAVGA